MSLIAIPFSGADIVAACSNNNIDPDPASNNITAWVVPDWYLLLYDCEQGAVGPSQKFVWFSPDLPTKIIRGPLTLLKRKGVSCGFDIRSALFYQEVYVVGPFANAELTPLITAGVTLDTNAPYDSASALRGYLETKL
jgi:hypothetical protein